MGSGSVTDLEAQQVTLSRVEEAGETESRDVTTQPYAQAGSNTSPVSLLSTGQDVDCKTQPVISQAEGSRRNNMPEMNTDQSQRNDADNADSGKPTQVGEGQIQAGSQTLANDPPVHPGPPNGASEPEPTEERQMKGDFDSSSKAFWTLFGIEAKRYDNAQVNTLKDDMDGVLIFAGLFSATLTAFVIDSKANLQVKPQDQMVYYLKQHSTLLSQISQQLSSIAPHASIPSTPPPPFPKFNPLASAIRINVFWFMALIFSLSAAFLAILLQKWVRDCMHVFQQYSDPLEIARLRQYLHEGFEAWRVPRFAEAIPGLLHISLFLFFAGLIDSLLNINTTVGFSAVIPIGIGVLLYIFTIFAPIKYPQSPYQTLFSRIVWHIFQKLHRRQYRDRGSNGRWKPVSANMAEGRMQLAMEETENRKSRDVLAIRWLIGNLTEGAKMEQLLTTLPGSFNSRWGIEIWKKVSNTIEDMDEDQSKFEPVVEPVVNTTVPTSSMPLVGKPTSNPPRNVVHELSARVARSLEACKNRERFSEDVWRERTCGCIETTASLVCGANANLAWFGDIRKLLGDIAVSVKLRELSLAGTDQVFVVRWTCLSLVAIQQTLQDDWKVRDYAELAVDSYADLAVESYSDLAVEPLAREDDASYAQALAGAQKIDKTLKNARECLYTLNRALRNTESLTEVEAILCDHVSEISDLEMIDISIEAKHLRNIDRWISATQSSIAHQITSQIPGVPNDPDPALVPFSQLAEHFRDPRKLQFICPEQTLRGFCSIVPTLRSLLKGRGDADAYKEVRKGLREFNLGIFCWQENELRRQLWRLQDLRDTSGFAFMVELFFLSLKQLLSTSTSPKNSHRDFGLYTGTFRAITSDWSKHKNSRGTQKLLLDVALSRAYDFQDEYPDYIVDEFVELTKKFFKGQEGVRIDEAIQQLNSFKAYAPKSFWDRLSNVITSAREHRNSLHTSHSAAAEESETPPVSS